MLLQHCLAFILCCHSFRSEIEKEYYCVLSWGFKCTLTFGNCYHTITHVVLLICGKISCILSSVIFAFIFSGCLYHSCWLPDRNFHGLLYSTFCLTKYHEFLSSHCSGHFITTHQNEMPSKPFWLTTISTWSSTYVAVLLFIYYCGLLSLAVFAYAIGYAWRSFVYAGKTI